MERRSFWRSGWSEGANLSWLQSKGYFFHSIQHAAQQKQRRSELNQRLYLTVLPLAPPCCCQVESLRSSSEWKTPSLERPSNSRSRKAPGYWAHPAGTRAGRWCCWSSLQHEQSCCKSIPSPMSTSIPPCYSWLQLTKWRNRPASWSTSTCSAAPCTSQCSYRSL